MKAMEFHVNCVEIILWKFKKALPFRISKNMDFLGIL